MSNTIPSDTHGTGDTGHVTDHNNMADVLGLIAQVLAADGGLYDATNATALTQLAAMQTQAGNTSGYPLAAFYPVAGSTARTSTSLVADPYLTVAGLQVNAVYSMEQHVVYNGGAAGSAGMFAWNYTVPFGAVLNFNVHYLSASGTIGVTNNRLETHLGGDTGAFAGTLGVSTAIGWDAWGILYMSSSSGSITFNWGCNTNTGTNTHVTNGSWLKLSRLA